MLMASALGTGLPAGPAEIGLALGVVLLARESLRPPAERRSLSTLAAAAGLVHGLGLAALLAKDLGVEAGLGSQLAAVLGMDAVHIVGVGLFALLLGRIARRPESRTPGRLAYAAGIAGMAFAFSVAAAGQATASESGDRSSCELIASSQVTTWPE